MTEHKALTYGEIRKKYGAKYGKESVFIDAYTCLFSPVFTKIAVRCRLLPNTVTIGMILVGIAGAALFWVPNVMCRIAGTVFIHLWFVLDCSDGETARATKTFSKYGKDLDYMAHTINHTLFIISFFMAMHLDGQPVVHTIILSGFLMLSDRLMRMIYVLRYIEILKTEKKDDGKQREEGSGFRMKDALLFIVNIFAQFPNFALIYPVVYIISKTAGYYYLTADILIATAYACYVTAKWIKKVHRSV